MIRKKDAGMSDDWIRGRRDERRLRPPLLRDSEDGPRSSRLQDPFTGLRTEPAAVATFGRSSRKMTSDHLTEGFLKRSIQDTDNAPNMRFHMYCVPGSGSDNYRRHRQ